MNHRARQWFFRHYWWFTLGCVALAVFLVHRADVEKRWEMTAAVIGVAASIVYFVQKQKLEETQLFDRLFVRFNDQYRLLHEQLQQISQDDEMTILHQEQMRILDRYFNLCAEEYLFYSEGRILQHVWQTWCRGMLAYLRAERIGNWWRQQEATNFHYGLTIAEIERGASERL